MKRYECTECGIKHNSQEAADDHAKIHALIKGDPSGRPVCQGCQKFPDELGYEFFTEEGESADDYVRQEEGTYNPVNGHFLCDKCYIEAGMPVGERGRRWVCP